MSKKSFPTLYKRTSTGKLQQWTIFVNGGSFWVEEGLVGGAITKTNPTKCEGKNVGRANETSPEQQAYKEAQAKWKKKTESGYTETKSEVDSTGYREPMLAFSYDDYKDLVADAFKQNLRVCCQPKLDGIRCIANKTGMWSRKGKRFISAPHILAALKPIFDKHPEAEFDGELYCDKLKHDFNTICSLVRRVNPTPEELKAAEEGIEYWIYDLPSEASLPFPKRWERAADLLGPLAKRPDCLKLLETDEVPNQQMLDAMYEQYMERGFEGQIIRFAKPYEHKRTTSLLKRKEFQDAEYTILGVVEGVGNRAGTVGYMEFKTKKGVEFRSNVKGSFEWLKQLLKDKKNLIGKKATIKFFNLTPAGVPRFPYVIAIRDYE